MSERELVGYLREQDAVLRDAEAKIAAVVEHVDCTSLYTVDGHRSPMAWLEANLHWSYTDARRRVRVARLAHDVDAAAKAIATGAVGVAQAGELAVAHANPRIGGRLADVIDVFLAHHDVLEFDDLRAVVRRWVELADMDGAHRDAAAAHRNRNLSMSVRDGVLHLAGNGTGLQAAVVKTVWERYVDAEWETDWAWTVATYGDDATPALMPRTTRSAAGTPSSPWSTTPPSAPPTGHRPSRS
jgi:hypothetical protein